ncbi:MAG: hypothetical protein ABIQ99_09805 [Thermoflexales bacterium]
METFFLTCSNDTATVWRVAKDGLTRCFSAPISGKPNYYCRIQGGSALTLFVPAVTAGSTDIWRSRDDGLTFAKLAYPDAPDARLRGAQALEDGSLCIIDNVEHRVWLLDNGASWRPHSLPANFKVNGLSRDKDGGLHLVGALAADGKLQNGFIDGDSTAAYAVATDAKLRFVRLNLSARDAAVFTEGGYSTQFDRVDAAASPLFITASTDSPDDISTLALLAGERGIATCLLRDQTPVGFWRDTSDIVTIVTDEGMLFRTQEAGFGWQSRSLQDTLGDALQLQAPERGRLTIRTAVFSGTDLLCVATVWQADRRGAPAWSGLLRSGDAGATFHALAKWPLGGEIAMGLAVTMDRPAAKT